MAQSEAQKKAQKKYDEENRQKRNYLARRSTARSFIRKNATEEDLQELEQLIAERRKEIGSV